MISPDWLSQLPALAERYRAKQLTAAEYAALYVLYWQVARYGARVAQRRSRADAPVDGFMWCDRALRLRGPARAEYLVELFTRYDLRGVRRRVGTALRQWLLGAWRLMLCERVPVPRAVLRLQASGIRPITLVAAYPRLLQPVLDKSDAFAFACHDLEHAWQFFHEPDSCRAQQGFARRLHRALSAGAFDAYLADVRFAEQFAYLAADMNTHVLHSLQYLRAILIEHHLRRSGLGPNEKLPAPAHAAIHAALAALLDGSRQAGLFAAWDEGALNSRNETLLQAAVCA